ncbi:hypothetical protein V2J09_008248 [Rumex salicifolius]
MTQTVVLKVGMSCPGCVGAVQRVLGKMEGVESFDIDIKEQKVTVKGTVQLEAVFQTVSKTGKKTSYWEESASVGEAESKTAETETRSGYSEFMNLVFYSVGSMWENNKALIVGVVILLTDCLKRTILKEIGCKEHDFYLLVSYQNLLWNLGTALSPRVGTDHAREGTNELGILIGYQHLGSIGFGKEKLGNEPLDLPTWFQIGPGLNVIVPQWQDHSLWTKGFPKQNTGNHMSRLQYQSNILPYWASSPLARKEFDQDRC